MYSDNLKCLSVKNTQKVNNQNIRDSYNWVERDISMDQLVNCKLLNGNTVIGRNTAIQVTAESRLNYYASCISYKHILLYTKCVMQAARDTNKWQPKNKNS